MGVKYAVEWVARPVSLDPSLTLPAATARVVVATEERARQLVAEGVAAGVARTYRVINDPTTID